MKKNTTMTTRGKQICEPGFPGIARAGGERLSSRGLGGQRQRLDGIGAARHLRRFLAEERRAHADFQAVAGEQVFGFTRRFRPLGFAPKKGRGPLSPTFMLRACAGSPLPFKNRNMGIHQQGA